MRLLVAIALTIALGGCADPEVDPESIASDVAIDAIADSSRLANMQDEIDQLRMDFDKAESDIQELESDQRMMRGDIDSVTSRVGY